MSIEKSMVTELDEEHYSLNKSWDGLTVEWIADHYRVSEDVAQRVMRTVERQHGIVSASSAATPTEPKPVPKQGDLKVSKCRACGAHIHFRKTKDDKTMPVDTKVVKILDWLGNIVEGHIPHWINCPDADKFRKGTK